MNNEIYIIAEKLINSYIKQVNGNMNKVRQLILTNLVNSKYTRNSNNFITIIWDKFNEKYPS